MSKAKAIFIGDYSNQETIELLKAFFNKYCDTLDIVVSGYKIDRIPKTPEIVDNCDVIGMNTNKFIYYKNTAQYAIITTPAARYIKEKKNQVIIYVLSDIKENSFSGVVGCINEVITDNQATFEFFSNINNQIIMSFVEDKTGQFLECLEKEIQTENQIDQDYLLVSIKDDPELREANGARHFFKSIADETQGTVISLTKYNLNYIATSNIFFKQATRTKKVLSEFTGTVVFADEASRVYYNDYLRRQGITPNENEEKMLEDFNLGRLEWYVKKHKALDFENDDSEYIKYRKLIENVYEIEECDKVKVSVIICRYNTPYELLSRAILSALNCGHENVEVIVVDDGSEESVEQDVKKEIHDERVFYYWKENEGPGLSREYGICHSSGKYVFFLDSDDTIHHGGRSF